MSPERNERLRLLVEVGDGRAAGCILENGFLRYCVEADADVHLVSPGVRSEEFVERYRISGVRLSYISTETPDLIRHRRLYWREVNLGLWLCRHGLAGVRRAMWSVVGRRLAIEDSGPWWEVIEDERPDCFASLNLHLGFARGMVGVCQ